MLLIPRNEDINPETREVIAMIIVKVMLREISLKWNKGPKILERKNKKIYKIPNLNDNSPSFVFGLNFIVYD